MNRPKISNEFVFFPYIYIQLNYLGTFECPPVLRHTLDMAPSL